MDTPPGRLELIAFARHVTSFFPGRVRVRHPALRKAAVAAEARARLEKEEGITGVEVNTVTGSALILYDAGKLSRDELIAKGVVWARWLKSMA